MLQKQTTPQIAVACLTQRPLSCSCYIALGWQDAQVTTQCNHPGRQDGSTAPTLNPASPGAREQDLSKAGAGALKLPQEVSHSQLSSQASLPAALPQGVGHALSPLPTAVERGGKDRAGVRALTTASVTGHNSAGHTAAASTLANFDGHASTGEVNTAKETLIHTKAGVVCPERFRRHENC